MDASVYAVLLLLTGILLLVAEVFIPSGGIIMVLALTSLAGAGCCAWSAWHVTNPLYFWIFLASMAVLVPIVIGVAFYVWPHTPIGRRAILEAPAPADVASFVELEERLARLVGEQGEAVTMLNPAGIVRIHGERLHCQSEGTIIELGTIVRVTSVQGNRVTVRPARLESMPATDAAPPQRSQAKPPPLDFEVS